MIIAMAGPGRRFDTTSGSRAFPPGPVPPGRYDDTRGREEPIRPARGGAQPLGYSDTTRGRLSEETPDTRGGARFAIEGRNATSGVRYPDETTGAGSGPTRYPTERGYAGGPAERDVTDDPTERGFASGPVNSEARLG